MEGQTSKYPFADGYFLTPVPLDNRSVHQLYFTDKQGVTYQIIINHGRLADNQDLPQFVEQEVEKMQRQVPDFCLEANSSPTTLGPAQCAIIQQTHKFLYEGCPFTQYCAFIHLPLPRPMQSSWLTFKALSIVLCLGNRFAPASLMISVCTILLLLFKC